MQEKQFAPDLKWIASLLALGILVIIGAFALDWFGGAPGLGLGQLLLIGIGGILIVAAFLFRRLAAIAPIASVGRILGRLTIGVARTYQVVALCLVAPFALFLVLEFVYRLITPGVGLFSTPDISTSLHQSYLARAQTAYFNEQPWSLDMWEHTYQVTVTVSESPYLGWDYPPYSSQYVNIGTDSLRVTPGADCSEDAYRIFIFGGSTLWGYGSPDFGAIPAYLQTALDEQLDGPICVQNYGELAYNSTQEYLSFMLQVRQGNVPDMAIFYSGVNDVRSAVLNNAPGLPYNLSVVRQGLNRNTNPFIEVLRANFYLVNNMVLNQPSPAAAAVTQTPDLDAQVVAMYQENMRITQATADVYGVRALFMWQPEIVDCGKTLTPHEQEQRVAMGEDNAQLYSAVYQRIAPLAAADPDDNFYSVATINEWVSVPEGEMFIDSNHLVPPGNEVIGRTIAAIALPQIEADTNAN